MVRATVETGESFPCIEFVAEAEACPICASPVQVQKSKRRKIITFRNALDRDGQESVADYFPAFIQEQFAGFGLADPFDAALVALMTASGFRFH